MKKIIEVPNKTAEQLKKLQNDNALREQLKAGPDLLIDEKGSDKYLDHRLEKVELINGEIIDLKHLSQFIDNKINTYAKKFSQEYYREIFRLHGWPIPTSGMISQKPSVVGKYTNEIIYGRFPKEILPAIAKNNKYDEIGMRLYKHFQFLTPEGVEKLEKFIEESITIMKRCSHWNEFVSEHAKKYGHPFQTSLFN